MIAPGSMRTALTAVAVGAALFGCSSHASAPAPLSADEDAEIVRVATSHLQQLLSYDATTLDDDVAEIDDLAQGEFAAQYTKLLGTTAGERIRRDRAASTATVVEIGIKKSRVDRPVLLAYVRQTTTSAALAGPRLDLSALEIEMARSDEDWRIVSITKVAPVRDREDQP